MEMAVALVDESKTEKKARLERLIMDRDSLQLEHDNLVSKWRCLVVNIADL